MMAKDVITSFRVDEQIWRQARAYAVLHGISMKQLIEFVLKAELKENRILRVKEVAK
jgi:antitoxin component of RelBE/YafQ-DinJ toxin-antitoxin module